MGDSDSYDSAASDISNSDFYCLYNNDSYYKYSRVKIGNVLYTKKELKEIICSDRPDDKEKVKSMIIDIIKENNRAALISFPWGRTLSIDEVLIEEKEQTAIHLAYYYNARDIVELIVYSIYTGHINSTDCYGLTHLHVGCWAGNEYLIQKCIRDGANVNAYFVETDTKNNTIYGITPLHMVSARGFTAPSASAKLLLENGADITATDSLGRTSLHIACSTSAFPYDRNNPDQIYKNVELMKVLLDAGLDVNQRDKHGNTPLLSIFPESFTVVNQLWPRYVPFAEEVEKLKLIIERGADVTINNSDGDTVLHRFIKMLMCSKYLEPDDYMSYTSDPMLLVKILEIIFSTKKPVNINAKNVFGETALQLAVSLMNANIVKFLLDHGANLSCLNFIENDEYCFCYPYEMLKLEQVYNVVNIMEMLLVKEFKLSLKDNLTIMKFLIHDVENCECGNFSFSDSYFRNDSFENKFRKLVAYGSSKHFEYVFNRDIMPLKSGWIINETRRAREYVKELFEYNVIAGFYIEKETVKLFKQIRRRTKSIHSISDSYLKKLEKEIDCMKTTKLVGETTLYDIMIKNPRDIYQYTRNINIHNLRLSSKFDIYKYMIEGHIAKSLIRHYIEKSAYDYLSELSLVLLPSLCIRRLLHYLSNEDILNLCLYTVCRN